MRAFWENAESIFETACSAFERGFEDCDWAILIDARGQIQVMDASGWGLDGLAAEHGNRTIYHVTRRSGTVRLEGRRGSQTCLLRSESPATAARHLFGYETARPPARLALPSPPVEESWTTAA